MNESMLKTDKNLFTLRGVGHPYGPEATKITKKKKRA